MKKLFLLIVLILFSLSSFGYTSSKFGKNLYGFVNKNKTTKRSLIEHFCSVLNKKEYTNNLIDGNFDYQKSVFVNLICDGTGIYSELNFNLAFSLKTNEINYYKNLIKNAENKIRKGLFKQCEIKNGYVVDNESLSNIDFVCVSKNIFDKIANDYLNIATYFAYGGFNEDKELKNWEEDFFISRNFCDKSYLKQDGADKPYCDHKKTYIYFKNTVGSLNKELKNLFLIDIGKENVYDIIRGDDKGKVNYFLKIKNSVYNELYFYGIFLTYYYNMMEKNSFLLQNKGGDLKKIDLISSREVQSAKDNILLARFSLKKSFLVLKDIYRTLPLHVGYLAIKEDFVKLRESLAKIYTPIDQLRYKLKNVQDKDKK